MRSFADAYRKLLQRCPAAIAHPAAAAAVAGIGIGCGVGIGFGQPLSLGTLHWGWGSVYSANPSVCLALHPTGGMPDMMTSNMMAGARCNNRNLGCKMLCARCQFLVTFNTCQFCVGHWLSDVHPCSGFELQTPVCLGYSSVLEHTFMFCKV